MRPEFMKLTKYVVFSLKNTEMFANLVYSTRTKPNTSPNWEAKAGLSVRAPRAAVLPGEVPPVLLPGERVRRVVLEERRRRRVGHHRRRVVLQRRRVRQLLTQVRRPHGQPGGGDFGVGLEGRVGRVVSLLLSDAGGGRGGQGPLRVLGVRPQQVSRSEARRGVFG